MRVLVSEFMSLDGVVQAPGGKDEDTSGGFRHGGWSFEYFDPDVMGAVVNEYAERSEVLLQGRRTYQVSAAAWPERSGDPFSDWINSAQKYVVSDSSVGVGSDVDANVHHPRSRSSSPRSRRCANSPAVTCTSTGACHWCEPC